MFTTYGKAKKLAEHYKALGQYTVHIDKDGTEPWQLVTKVEPGGVHRLSIPVSASVRAHDPECGMDFSWSVDFEERSANGTGTYKIQADYLRRIMNKLPPDARSSFRAQLRETASAVRKQATEYADAMGRLMADAAELDRIIADS